MVDLLKEAEEALVQNQLEVQNLTRLTQMFPDLGTFTGRWGRKVKTSAAVNPQATKFTHRFNCGCCPDSPLEIWPYLDTPYGEVYSSPPRFYVGEKSDYGARPSKGWANEMRAAGIPETLIKEVQGLFDMWKRQSIEAASSGWDDDSVSPEAL